LTFSFTGSKVIHVLLRIPKWGEVRESVPPPRLGFSAARPPTRLALWRGNGSLWAGKISKVAGALGFVNIMMGAFAFAESPADLGSDGATFLAVLTFSMGIVAIAAGISSRRSRSLAKEALSTGTVVEASGTVGTSSMQANRITLMQTNQTNQTNIRVSRACVQLW